MDRLPALTIALALAGACDKKTDGGQAEPTSRVNAAKVAAKQTDPAAFCDQQFAGTEAPAFEVPPLAGGAALPAAPGGGRWRWVNVWATWCKPCVDEIPRLVAWQAKLGTYALQLVSVDESDEDVTAYRRLHPDTPASVRLAKPDEQGAWFARLGLDAGAPIPVHVFVDPEGRVRCVRAGGVREQDLAMVEALLARGR